MKKKNPLFVVTNNGKDVETASGLCDLVIKKLGLTKFVEFLDQILKMLLESVSSYPMLVAINEVLTAVLSDIEVVFKRFFPTAFTYKA